MRVTLSGGSLAAGHDFSSGPWASWANSSHRSSFRLRIRTSATQTPAEWWLLDAAWQASHMLYCELFSPLSFHIFKGSLKAISVTIVSRSSCIASLKLSVTDGRAFWQITASPGTNFEPKICGGKKPSAIQLVSQGACVAFYPNFEWSLGPVTICPLISHLVRHHHWPSKQLQLPPPCPSLAFTMKKLNDSKRSR